MYFTVGKPKATLCSSRGWLVCIAIDGSENIGGIIPPSTKHISGKSQEIEIKLPRQSLFLEYSQYAFQILKHKMLPPGTVARYHCPL